jgi:hypothetical protein
MGAFPVAELLTDSSPIFVALIGGGLVLGIYGQAAKMPRVLAIGIVMVFFGTLLLAIQAQTAPEFEQFR